MIPNENIELHYFILLTARYTINHRSILIIILNLDLTIHHNMKYLVSQYSLIIIFSMNFLFIIQQNNVYYGINLIHTHM